MHPSNTPEPMIDACSFCGCAIEVERTYYLFLGSSRPLPACEECARWYSEGFFPLACMLEAQTIIREAHQLLNAGEVQP